MLGIRSSWHRLHSVLHILLLFPSLSFASNSFGIKFLQKNKAAPGVVTLPSGLQYKIIVAGTGTHHPTKNSPCDVHYEGRTAENYPSGKVFDSTYELGKPTSFAPNQVIKGWTEVLQLMVTGDKWRVYIPSNLAYGEGGTDGIPGGSVLVFTVELVKIKGDKVPAKRKPASAENTPAPTENELGSQQPSSAQLLQAVSVGLTMVKNDPVLMKIVGNYPILQEVMAKTAKNPAALMGYLKDPVVLAFLRKAVKKVAPGLAPQLDALLKQAAQGSSQASALASSQAAEGNSQPAKAANAGPPVPQKAAPKAANAGPPAPQKAAPKAANAGPPAPQKAAGDNAPFNVVFDVINLESKPRSGSFTMEVHPEWAPLGAQRIKELVADKFYDGAGFFRVIDGFMAQFGIAADPAKTAKWRQPIKDDKKVARVRNTRGMVSFGASQSSNSRTTHLFINFDDNSNLDSDGFTPVAKVVKGMDVVDRIFKIGEEADQGYLRERGDAYLREEFPQATIIKRCRIEAASPQSNAQTGQHKAAAGNSLAQKGAKNPKAAAATAPAEEDHAEEEPQKTAEEHELMRQHEEQLAEEGQERMRQHEDHPGQILGPSLAEQERIEAEEAELKRNQKQTEARKKAAREARQKAKEEAEAKEKAEKKAIFGCDYSKCADCVAFPQRKSEATCAECRPGFILQGNDCNVDPHATTTPVGKLEPHMVAPDLDPQSKFIKRVIFAISITSLVVGLLIFFACRCLCNEDDDPDDNGKTARVNMFGRKKENADVSIYGRSETASLKSRRKDVNMNSFELDS